ncbi:MAG: DUF1802 family protein [candidate division NC10 bacterium]|nr:DUF1802 family protein [candidate division NC10 bacterium]
MIDRTAAALKEWAIVCKALAEGRQTLLIRKGGIEEIKDGFQVAHREFWLFPTYVHQSPADVLPAVHPDFAAVQAAQPSSGILRIQLLAAVADAVKVTDLDRLRALEGCHILTWDCIASRFRYRNRPGVHVLTLRVYRRPEPVELPVALWYDGCVSWVELDRSIETAGCIPVLSAEDFAARAEEVRSRLRAPASAG